MLIPKSRLSPRRLSLVMAALTATASGFPAFNAQTTREARDSTKREP